MKLSIFILIIILIQTSLAASKKNSEYNFEAGLVGKGGNSKTETWTGKIDTWKKLSSISKLSVGGHYTYGTSSEVIIVRNWDTSLRYDRILSTLNSVFSGIKIEGDRFNGYELRQNYDLGYSHDLYNKNKLHIKGDLGYRYQIEKNDSGVTQNTNNFRLYLENRYSFTEKTYAKIWLEYLNSFDDTENWMLNFEPSIYLTIIGNLFFKFGYKGQYRNITAEEGLKKYDFSYTSSFIAVF